jgi:hypothetical protein
MSAGTEVAVNEGVSGEEVLGLPRQFEPLLTLSSSRWSMRVLGSIIQISALSVLDVRKQLTLSDAIASQLVGHDDPRFILQTCQQSFGRRVGPEQGCRARRRAGRRHARDSAARLDTDEDPRPCAICRLAIADEVADGRRSSRRISCRSVAPSRRRRRYRVLLKISSTSRRLRLNTWYSQTAWLMISAGNRWRKWGSGGGVMPSVWLTSRNATRVGYRDNASPSVRREGRPGWALSRHWLAAESNPTHSARRCSRRYRTLELGVGFDATLPHVLRQQYGRACQYRGWHACPRRNFQSVGLPSAAGHDLVGEHLFVAACRGVHRHARGVLHRLPRVREFVEVRRKQRSAPCDVV